MSNICLKINKLDPKGARLVLAMITESDGSTPQKAGISAVFSREGLETGTIGGGVMEGRTQQMAREAALAGDPLIAEFSFDNDIHQKSEAICGGHAKVLIDPTVGDHYAIFDEAERLISGRIPCVLATFISRSSDSKTVVSREIYTSENIKNISGNKSGEIAEAVSKLLSVNDEEGFIKIEISEDRFILLESVIPPLQLIIAGAGHIGKSLSHIGSLLGFRTTVIDNRAEFANRSNLPDADSIVVEDIGTALSSVRAGVDTYIVIVTRGHNDDASALKQCIGKEAAYIGMIGSRGKVEKMRRNFIENGWADEEQWSKIHAPVGIDIKSRTVEEIALSIAAEIVLVKNQKKNAKLTVKS